MYHLKILADHWITNHRENKQSSSFLEWEISLGSIMTRTYVPGITEADFLLLENNLACLSKKITQSQIHDSCTKEARQRREIALPNCELKPEYTKKTRVMTSDFIGLGFKYDARSSLKMEAQISEEQFKASLPILRTRIQERKSFWISEHHQCRIDLSKVITEHNAQKEHTFEVEIEAVWSFGLDQKHIVQSMYHCQQIVQDSFQKPKVTSPFDRTMLFLLPETEEDLKSKKERKGEIVDACLVPIGREPDKFK